MKLTLLDVLDRGVVSHSGWMIFNRPFIDAYPVSRRLANDIDINLLISLRLNPMFNVMVPSIIRQEIETWS